MFVVVDIETTGLNPGKDYVLEVGVVLTDDNLIPQHEYSELIKYDAVTHLLNDLNDVVREMHTESGLIEALLAGQGLSMISLEEQLCNFLERNGAEGLPMCGSSIHFDRAFLKEYFPKFESMFHYRNIDTSTVKNLAEHWNKPVFDARPQGMKKHRVIPDCYDTIAELSYYRDNFLFVSQES